MRRNRSYRARGVNSTAAAFGLLAAIALSGCGAVPRLADDVDRSQYLGWCEPHELSLADGAGPNGPEDITMDARGVIYVSSNDHRARDSAKPLRAGAIYRYDVARDGDVRRMPVRSESNRLPAYFETNFAPHGISLLEQGGVRRLFAINHRRTAKPRPPDSGNLANVLNVATGEVVHSDVEIFRIEGTGEGEVLVHEASIPSAGALASGPEPRGGRELDLRDLVAVGPKQFFATNTPGGVTQAIDLAFLRNRIHSIVYFNGEGYSVALDRQPSPDGINIARDHRHLYTANVQNGELIAFRTNLNPPGEAQPTTATLEEVGPRIVLGGHLDNIEWADASRRELLVAGHPNPVMFGFAFLRADVRSPSRVYRVGVGEDGRLQPGSAKLLYGNDGEQISAASVAVRHTGGTLDRLVIGSVFAPAFLVCELDAH